MGFTNKTPNYNLPQWIGTDQPTWLVDVNGAFSAIDTAISDVNVTATGAKNTADSASGLASTAKEAADAATQAATDATTAATAATNAATAATEKAAQAEQTASAAAGTASTAITNANNAVQVANSAETKADQALALGGVGTWYTKTINQGEIEVISPLVVNTNSNFPKYYTTFFNDKLKLMCINTWVSLVYSEANLTTSIQGFDGNNSNYFIPVLKLPFSFDSGKDINIVAGYLFMYYSDITSNPLTAFNAPSITHVGIKMYQGSAWIGMVHTAATFTVKSPGIVMSNVFFPTSNFGKITLNNWSAA